MKLLNTKMIVVAAMSIFLFGSCKKNISSDIASASSDEDGTVLKTVEPGGTTALYLKPNAKYAYDAYVEEHKGMPSSIHTNFNSVHELSAECWKDADSELVTRRFFIKFSQLSEIPTTAHVISATLILKVLDKTEGSSSTPQGNSVYPGSPWAPNNRMLIQQVTSAWDQTTITWATQPQTTTVDQDTSRSSVTQWSEGYHGDMKTDVTAIVQKMVANPTKNYGFAFRLEKEKAYRSIVTGSGDNQDLFVRPHLAILYQ